MVSDKQVEQACVWRKRKAASGHGGGSEALVPLVAGRELSSPAAASWGECVSLG